MDSHFKGNALFKEISAGVRYARPLRGVLVEA